MSSSGDYLLVLQKLVDPGTLVKKGEIVAEFDRQNMINRLEDFKAVVIESETSHAILRAQLAVYEKAHEQKIRSGKAEKDKAQLDLKTIPVRSAIESEFLRLAAEETDARHGQFLNEVRYVGVSKNAQIRRSELEVMQQKLEFKRSEANVEKMVLRAPMDGITVMQSLHRHGQSDQVKQGDLLSPGTNFMQIVDPSSMVVNALVNQVDSQRIRIGQRATVRFDAYPGLAVPGRVHSIGAMTKTAGFRASYVREVPLVIKLEYADARVVPDLSVSADIVLATEQKAAAIAPRWAIFSTTATPKPFVFVRSAAGWDRREVELGLSNHTAVVLRSGVQKGAVLAAELPKSLQETKVSE